MTGEVEANLHALRDAIDDELRRCGRSPESLTLVGVAKRQPHARVVAAIEAGLRDVGESYLQEARAKFEDLPPVRKHFVGHIQTNKAAAIAELFGLVQSVDREEAGTALARAAQRLDKVLPVLIQLNISPVERYGCPPEQAERLADTLRAQPSLRFDGVMAIGPHTGDRATIAKAFELAAMTLGRVGGTTLSIGMSGDWPEAVRAGSTMVRIGEALFGSRRAPQERREERG